jgi:hypothetical protein
MGMSCFAVSRMILVVGYLYYFHCHKESLMTTMVKQGQCSLINGKSTGHIQYEIGVDDNNQRYVQLITSTSGGFLSPDKVAEKDIKKALMTVRDKARFSSTIFHSLFRGKSANNPSFLAAVLRAEGVITPSKHHVYKHRILNIDAISLLKPVK